MMLIIVILLLYLVASIESKLDYSVVLVGGGLDGNNTEVWNTIIALGGGKDKARIGVVSAASEDPCCDKDSSYVYYAGLLKLYGAVETYFIPVTVDSKALNSDPEVVANIKRMTGFMFGGGDQLRIIESFYNGDAYTLESAALSAIKSTLEGTGGVVAGTSAGTDCQTSNVMITGGYSYYGLDDGVQIYSNPDDINTSSNKVTAYAPGGIGLFPYGFVDTHYANRGRQGRSMSLLMDSTAFSTTSTHAFGIDENTALVVTGEGDQRIGTVIGERSVLVLDSQYATPTSTSAAKKHDSRNIVGMRASRMTHNDVLNLSSYEINFASYKTTLTTSDTTSLYHSKDVFASDAVFEFDKVVDSLLQSTVTSSYGMTKEHTPQYKVSMDKNMMVSGQDMEVRAVGGTNPSTQEFEISYDGLWLSVTE